MSIFFTFLFFFVTACVSFSEKPTPPSSQKRIKEGGRLYFVNEQVLPHAYTFRSVPLGGLSALSYYPPTQTFFALSDDKGKKGPPRFYHLKLQSRKKKLNSPPQQVSYSFKVTDQVFLTRLKGLPFLPIDPEGMAVLYNKGENPQVFVSSEGAQMPDLIQAPSLLSFNLKGEWQKTWPLASVFWPQDLKQVGTWGVRENKAFEALALSPDKKYLWLATESPLHQDRIHVKSLSDVSVSKKKNQISKQYIRFTRFKVKSQTLSSQFVYPMDSEIKLHDMQGENGLTDFLSLGNMQFLVIERAYLKNKNISGKRKSDLNVVKLFLADCSPADNVFQHPSLKNKTFTPCNKQQVWDFLPSAEHSQLSPASLQKYKVDNLEGLALGPRVDKNTYLVVLVSDNNFNPSQKTQFLFFHYREK